MGMAKTERSAGSGPSWVETVALSILGAIKADTITHNYNYVNGKHGSSTKLGYVTKPSACLQNLRRMRQARVNGGCVVGGTLRPWTRRQWCPNSRWYSALLIM